MASHSEALEQGDLVSLRDELLDHFWAASEKGSAKAAMLSLLHKLSPDIVVDYERIDLFLKFLSAVEDDYGDFRKDYTARLPGYLMEVVTYLHFADDELTDYRDFLSPDAQLLCEDVLRLEALGGLIPETQRFTTPAFVFKIKRLFDLEEFQAEILPTIPLKDLPSVKAFYRDALEFTSHQHFMDTDRLSQRIRERENRIVSVLNHYLDDPYHSPFWMYPHAANHIEGRDDIEIYETRAKLDMPEDLIPHYDAFFRMSEDTISETFIQIAQEALSPVYRLNLQAYEQNFSVNPRMRLLAFYSGVAFKGDELDAIHAQFGGDVSEAVYRLVNTDEPHVDFSDLPYDVVRDVACALRAYCHEAMRRGIAECEDGEFQTAPSLESFTLIDEALKLARRLIDCGAGTTEFYAICERAGFQRNKLAAILDELGDFERQDEDRSLIVSDEDENKISQPNEDNRPDIEVEYGPVGADGQIMVPANDR